MFNEKTRGLQQKYGSLGLTLEEVIMKMVTKACMVNRGKDDYSERKVRKDDAEVKRYTNVFIIPIINKL